MNTCDLVLHYMLIFDRNIRHIVRPMASPPLYGPLLVLRPEARDSSVKPTSQGCAMGCATSAGWGLAGSMYTTARQHRYVLGLSQSMPFVARFYREIKPHKLQYIHQLTLLVTVKHIQRKSTGQHHCLHPSGLGSVTYCGRPKHSCPNRSLHDGSRRHVENRIMILARKI